jgi:hypothetical protein
VTNDLEVVAGWVTHEGREVPLVILRPLPWRVEDREPEADCETVNALDNFRLGAVNAT